MNTTLKALTFSAGLSLGFQASAQTISLGSQNAEVEAIITQCIDTNPQAPQQCVKDGMAAFNRAGTDIGIKYGEDLGRPFKTEDIDFMYCVADETAAAIADHYETALLISQRGSDMLISSSDEDFAKLKALLLDGADAVTDCALTNPPVDATMKSFVASINNTEETLDNLRALVSPTAP